MDRLSKPHFICKNSIELVIVERDKPLQTLKLIVFQLASTKDSWLFADLFLDCVGEIVID